MISTKTVAHFKIKTYFKFQIFKLFIESLRYKDKVKRNDREMMRITA